MRYIAIYVFTFATVPSKYHQQIMQIVVILINALFDHFWMVTPFLYPTISTIKPTRLCTQNIAIMLQGNCLDRFENINHKLQKLQQICILYNTLIQMFILHTSLYTFCVYHLIDRLTLCFLFLSGTTFFQIVNLENLKEIV